MPKPSRRVVDKPAPLTFHRVYGKGITMSNHFQQATRVAGFGDAIVFSSRPVRTYEKVFLRHRQKEVDWIGSLRVGFCLPDPQGFTQETLPNLAFKNLTDQGGYFLRACPDEVLRTSPIIYVYYSYDGVIYVGGYGQTTPPQPVLTINEHSGPYYLFCEIYGKTDQIELVDETTLPNQQTFNHDSYLNPYQDVTTIVTSKLRTNPTLLQLQHFNYLFATNFQHTFTFLPTRDHNSVMINNDRIVCVNNRKIKASYAFLNTPMKLGDVLLCKVMDCDTNISSVLLFGLTTCQPKSIEKQRLPEETEALISQYASSIWLIETDLNVNLSLYDELAFWFDSQGHVYLSINNRPATVLKCSIPSHDLNRSSLYPFFDLYGQITSLSLYNFAVQSQIDFNRPSNGRSLCSICYEHLVDTQFLPCLCLVCNQCAMAIKRPSLISDCPFDRKHITQIRPL